MTPRTNDVWLVIPTEDGKTSDNVPQLFTAGKIIAEAKKGKLVAIVPGYHAEAAIEQASRLGADQVITMNGPEYKNFVPYIYSYSVFHLMNLLAPAAVVFAKDETGEAMSERFGMKLKSDATVGYELFGVVDEDSQLKWNPFRVKEDEYKAITVSNSSPELFIVETAEFEPAALGEAKAQIRTEYFHVLVNQPSNIVTEVLNEAADRIIECAADDCIVSGGKPVGSHEGYERLITPLAKVLGARLGASRPVIDLGWEPFSYQIGKTARIEAPNLYLACGIHGSIQHRNGMGKSKHVIAINSNPNAPIYEFSEYGVVADIHRVLPELTAIIAKKKGVSLE